MLLFYVSKESKMHLLSDFSKEQLKAKMAETGGSPTRTLKALGIMISSEVVRELLKICES